MPIAWMGLRPPKKGNWPGYAPLCRTRRQRPLLNHPKKWWSMTPNRLRRHPRKRPPAKEIRALQHRTLRHPAVRCPNLNSTVPNLFCQGLSPESLLFRPFGPRSHLDPGLAPQACILAPLPGCFFASCGPAFHWPRCYDRQVCSPLSNAIGKVQSGLHDLRAR